MDDPFAAKLNYRPLPRPVVPLARDPIDRLMQRLAQMKPEPSFTALGRAKAKGTGLEWVSPRMSPLETLRYNHVKRYGFDTFGIPITPSRAVADDTAAPLTSHLAQWLRGR